MKMMALNHYPIPGIQNIKDLIGLKTKPTNSQIEAETDTYYYKTFIKTELDNDSYLMHMRSDISLLNSGGIGIP
jgi:hypothetical protein